MQSPRRIRVRFTASRKSRSPLRTPYARDKPQPQQTDRRPAATETCNRASAQLHRCETTSRTHNPGEFWEVSQEHGAMQPRPGGCRANWRGNTSHCSGAGQRCGTGGPVMLGGGGHQGLCWRVQGVCCAGDRPQGLAPWAIPAFGLGDFVIGDNPGVCPREFSPRLNPTLVLEDFAPQIIPARVLGCLHRS